MMHILFYLHLTERDMEMNGEKKSHGNRWSWGGLSVRQGVYLEMVPIGFRDGVSRLGGYVDASPVRMAPRVGVVTKKDCNATGITACFWTLMKAE